MTGMLSISLEESNHASVGLSVFLDIDSITWSPLAQKIVHEDLPLTSDVENKIEFVTNGVENFFG
jgi:hypothetical protein